MNKNDMGNRVQARIGQLRYFKEDSNNKDLESAKKIKLIADEHLLWGYFSADRKDFTFFSPLSDEYLAFFDVYLEFFFKKKCLPRVKEVENYLRDQNQSVSYSHDFNWELAEKLMNSLGLALSSSLDKKGGPICHCYGHHLSFLVHAIKEFKFDTLAKLQGSIAIGDKCKKCLSYKGLPNRALALSQVFSLSQASQDHLSQEHWDSWSKYFSKSGSGFLNFLSKSWQDQVQCLSECLKSSFALFFQENGSLPKVLPEVLNYHFEQEQGQIDIFLPSFVEENLSAMKAYQDLMQSHLQRVLKKSFKLRLFRQKSDQAILID